MPDDALDGVLRLHAVVDELVAPLVSRHAARLKCAPGCAACCVDGLTVFEVEAARISSEAPQVLAQPPGPLGACAFLDAAGACRIYAQRPYVCRTQGLPLRWVEERGRRVVERRDICPLNAPGEPVESLHKDDCWPLGLVEARLGALQDRVDGGARTRVPLRALFGEQEQA